MLTGRRLRRVVVRNAALRWPVELPASIGGQRFGTIDRRAKYLLLPFDGGSLILHLGMSGHPSRSFPRAHRPASTTTWISNSTMGAP